MALYAARYRLPLRAPLVVGDARLTHREGYALRLELGRGAVGYGDLCPLPGRSPEALDDAARALREDGWARLPPSASWAVAAARAALIDPAVPAVRSASLVPSLGDPPAGAAALKLKVGRAPLDEERAWVRAVARATTAELRLDGNRGLDLDAAVALAEAAGPRLSFLEEPVPAEQLDAALAALPVALDETLEEGRTPEGARAWVLKPTLLGAERTLDLIDLAETRGARVLISSAYEARPGRDALARLAAAVAPDEAHGLDTARALADDLDPLEALPWERWR